MAKEQKNTENPTPAVVPFSVSVMPKEFRGKEGLRRASLVEGEASTIGDHAFPVPASAPTTVQISPPLPSQAPASAGLEQAPAPVHRVPKWLFVVGGGALLLLTGFAVWALWLSPPAPTPTPKPVPKPPTPVVQPVKPTPPPVPAPAPKPVEKPKEVGAPGRDTDSDGLTDVEEILYGTIPTRPDTDGDGFLDGNEVFHLYHPNGLAPQTLLDTGFVQVYTSPLFPYQFHVPKRWKIQEISPERKVSISSTTGETITVQLRIIDPGQSLAQWRTAVLTPSGAGEAFKTKSGFDGMWEMNHLTGSVRVGSGEVLMFTYVLDTATAVEYRQTFEMLLNSLQRIASQP